MPSPTTATSRGATARPPPRADPPPEVRLVGSGRSEALGRQLLANLKLGRVTLAGFRRSHTPERARTHQPAFRCRHPSEPSARRSHPAKSVRYSHISRDGCGAGRKQDSVAECVDLHRSLPSWAARSRWLQHGRRASPTADFEDATLNGRIEESELWLRRRQDYRPRRGLSKPRVDITRGCQPTTCSAASPRWQSMASTCQRAFPPSNCM